MPASLLDMFNPTDAAGGQASFGDALASRTNSLIGLGLGLLQPSNPLRGQSTWGNALEGFQSGSTADTRQAQLRQQTARDAYQRQQDALDRAFKERQFTQSTLTPYQKMQADLARVAGTPEEQQTRDFYRSQLDAGPPQTREVFDPTLGRNVVQEWDSRTKQYKTATMGGGGTPTAEQGGAPAAPGPGGPGPQPVLPPKKPLSAHEQSAIDAADKAVVANRGVIGTLQDAKRLSQTALSGPFTTQRAEIGAQIPDYAPGMNSNQRSKDTLLLNNAVISQAVEQLKATFGGNPSEGERKILLDLAGSVNSPHDVREKIYNNAIKAAQEKLDLNERQAREIRSGSYYNPGGGASAPRAAASAPSAAPNADAIRALKQNPQRRAEFDAKYGEGSAMRILRGE